MCAPSIVASIGGRTNNLKANEELVPKLTLKKKEKFLKHFMQTMHIFVSKSFEK